MGHREIRELLEKEILDSSELVGLLAVEQELHDYFSSQPSEAFRRQLKAQLLTEARKYRFFYRLSSRRWIYPAAAIVAVAAMAVIAVTPASLRQNWSTRLFGTRLVEQVAEAPGLGSPDVIGDIENIAESSPGITGQGDKENSGISLSENQEQGLKTGKASDEYLLNRQPEFWVADRPAALTYNGLGSQGSQGTSESPEVPQETPGLPGAALDFDNTGAKSLSRGRLPATDANVVINAPVFSPVTTVKVFKDQNRDWQSTELQRLAAALGMDQALTANSDGSGYSLVSNGKKLTLLTEVPNRIQFTRQPASPGNMAGSTGPAIQQTDALSQARKVLFALGYPDQGFKVVRQTMTAAANYEFIFNQQAAELPITDSEIRVEIDRRSGEVVELAGTFPNLTELGEHPVISIDRALEKLWQAKMTEAAVDITGPLAAKSADDSFQRTMNDGKINQPMGSPPAAASSLDVWSNLPIPRDGKLVLEKIELIEEYERIDQQGALVIPRYRLGGQLADGRHFEALVKAIE